MSSGVGARAGHALPAGISAQAARQDLVEPGTHLQEIAPEQAAVARLVLHSAPDQPIR